jgi:hypothetical protein
MVGEGVIVNGLFEFKALWCFGFSDGFVNVGWHGLGVDSKEGKIEFLSLRFGDHYLVK